MLCDKCAAEYDDSFAFCPCCGKRDNPPQTPIIEGRERPGQQQPVGAAGKSPEGAGDVSPVGAAGKSMNQELEQQLKQQLGEQLGEQKPVAKPQSDKLVLIVDDDEAIVRLISANLNMNGYKAIAALDGEQAVMITHRKVPDLILLDIAMPGLHGFSVIDKLRQSNHTINIPIVIVSSFNDEASHHTAETKGIRDYIVKPFEIDHLLAVVNSYFE